MRQINKAIYIVIERYHRLYGLELYLFSHGSFGPGYWGFQIASHRTWDNRSREVNDCNRGGQQRNGYVLVGYQDKVSIPNWAIASSTDASGNQPTLDVTSTTRTENIVEWLEQNMQLRNYFLTYETEIHNWRHSYSVEQSEKYILMINIAGLASQHIEKPLRTPRQVYDLPYGGDYQKQEATIDKIHRALCVKDGWIEIIGFEHHWFSRNGLALINDRTVDIWKDYVSGLLPSQILLKYDVY